jgi:hypothetical protein
MGHPRDFNHFFGEAMERNRAAGDAVRKMHAARPFSSRDEIHAAFQAELERLQPEVLSAELAELARQVSAVMIVALRRGFQIDGRRTELAELAAEMCELSRATEYWIDAETDPPVEFSLQLIEKYKRLLPLLADSIKLPARATGSQAEPVLCSCVANGSELRRGERWRKTNS